MIRIAVDCRFSGTQSGLGRYTRAIATNLVRQGQGERYILMVRSTDEPWLQEVRHDCDIVQVNIPHYSFEEHTQLPGHMSAAGAHLLFAPHFNVPVRCPVPVVMTIHDLILHRYPNRASLAKRLAYHLLIARSIAQARSIIAISRFVHDEIGSTYGQTAARKTYVVHQGVDERFRPASAMDIERVQKTYGITQPYYMYVGNAKQHKNVRVLIDAFTAAGMEQVALLLISDGPEVAALEPLPPGCKRLSGVPDTDLPALYTGARALLTASLYEGFCLPVAEAMACGTPVIASDRTAIPEVAHGHALLVEPTVDAFTRALQSALPHRAPFVGSTWEQTAKVTRTILLEALV